MARRSKDQIALEKQIDDWVEKHISNKQFNIFDLAKISKAGKDASQAGANVEKAIIEACEKYAIE